MKTKKNKNRKNKSNFKLLEFVSENPKLTEDRLNGLSQRQLEILKIELMIAAQC